MDLEETYQDGNYDELIQHISKIEIETRTFSHHYYLVKSLNRLSEINEAIEYAKPILPLVKQENELNYLKIVYELIWAYQRKGDLESGIQYFDKAYEIIDDLTYEKSIKIDQKTINSIINLGGVIHYSLGKSDLAMDYFQQLIENSEDIVNEEILQGGKINLALIHLDKGNYKEVIDLLHDALELAEKNQHKKHIRVAANNLAYIYTTIGDLNHAEKYAKRTVNIAKEINDNWGLALIYNNLGVISYKKGDHLDALGYLDKSYKLMKDFDDPEYLSRIQFFKLLVHLDLEKRFEANESLQEIRSFTENMDNSRVQLIYDIAESIYQGYSSLYRHKLKAEERLKEIISSEPEIESELISYVYLFLTRLLLEQLSEIQNKFKGDITELQDDERSVLQEVEDLSNEIIAIANKQNSPELQLQVHYIQAHLSILRLNSQDLSYHINKADEISKKWGLSKVTISEPTPEEVGSFHRESTPQPMLMTSINDIIHSFPRLKIMVVLSEGTKLTFSELQDYTKLSSGNLSNHCKILIDKEYMIKTKEVVDDRFQTIYSMTNTGIQAFNKYKSRVKYILQSTRD